VPTVVISGVTVTGGNVAGSGGGIKAYNTAVTLTNVIITGNRATSSGGGVLVEAPDGRLTVYGALISHNEARQGGGLCTSQSRVEVDDTMIVSNTASASGGGVFLSNAAAVYTQTGDSLIAHNIATGSAAYNGGGGLYVQRGVATLLGGNLYDNHSTSVNSSGGGGGAYLRFPEATLRLVAGQIISNSGKRGGGVHVREGTLVVSGGDIVSNSGEYGGGLQLEGGRVTLCGGQVLSNTAQEGGGIRVYGTSSVITVTGASTIAHNSATGNGGGLMLVQGQLRLDGGSLISNTADDGAGAFIGSGSAVVSGGHIQLNAAASTGGGLFVQAGSLTLSGGHVSSNTASYGGGLYVAFTSAVLTQTGPSRISHNHADVHGGGVFVGGSTATLSGTDVHSNTALRGAGLFVDSGRLRVARGQITGNHAEYGGGAYVNNEGAVLTLVNCTVSNNSSQTTGGGGIVNANGSTVLTHATIASNTANAGGAGIHAYDTRSITMTNTIVAHNLPDNCGADAVVSLGHNLEDGTTCGLTATGDISNTAPMLGPLTHDGSAWVHPLLVGSPAIDAGICIAGITTDQRGVVRPVGVSCDIGAYEWEGDRAYLALVVRDD
jgi:hypothetical protein